MARLRGVERKPSLLVRLVFFLARRRLGHVPRPLRIRALRPGLLVAGSMMDLASEPRTLRGPVVKLAQVRVAMRVGCPF
jgi:hypothetical protein